MGSPGDNLPRQSSFGLGVGVGASEVKTQEVRSDELNIGPAIDRASGIAGEISEQVFELGAFNRGGVNFENVQISNDGVLSGQYSQSGSRISRRFETRVKE